jgi:imidazolonepropionase-like amidohydrolase
MLRRAFRPADGKGEPMRRHTRALAAALIGLAGTVVPAQERPLVIRNATILTAAAPAVIEKGTIVIREGKIAAVGAAVAAPADGQIIDATGMYVMPGIIDTHSHLGVYAWPAVDANSDGNEMTSPVTAQVRALDSFNFEDPAIRRAVAGGVTIIQVFPGSGNLVGGQSVVLKLKPEAGRLATVFANAPPGMKMALGENPKRVYGMRNQAPSTRMGNFAVLRQAFTQARDYQRKWQRWNETKEGTPPDRDLKLEALVEILEGRRNVHVHCYRQDEMQNMIALADEFGFKIRSFQHTIEGYKVASELAARGIGASTWPDTYGGKMEMADGIPYNCTLLAANRVTYAVHSDSADRIQRLWHEAARTVRYGVPEEDAVKSITRNAAWIAGVDQYTGSIEIGKDADLAIFNGHPFDVFSLVQKTLIDGVVVFDRARDWAKWNHLEGTR